MICRVFGRIIGLSLDVEDVLPGFVIDQSSVKIFIPVVFRDSADYTTGIPGGNRPFRDGAVHDTAGTDDGIGANRHSGQNHRVGSDPDIVANRNVKTVFIQ